MHPSHLTLPLLAALMFAFANHSRAEMPHHDHGLGPQAMEQKPAGGHAFSPKWPQTLSDKQKLEIDQMHLQVDKVEKLLRAKIHTAEIELRLLSIQDNADTKAINAKIDEITKLKGEVMRNRYAHIVEMRQALTPQQRISYDMGVLNHQEKRGH